MPRPRTGSVETLRRADGSLYYRARIQLADDSRVRVDIPEEICRAAGGKSGEERRELYAQARQDREDDNGELLAAKRTKVAARGAETCDGWHDRYVAHCKTRGLAGHRLKGYRWRKWISPHLGQLLMKDVQRDQIEALRNVLDLAIQGGETSWKNAKNIWGEVSVSFSEAATSKNPALRVRSDDPTATVKPPDVGGKKSKVYPYPSEFLTVVSAPEEAVPLDWKECHTVAVYTYLRPGELYVLDWEQDVDLQDEVIHITRAWDYDAGCLKSTKTGETRDVPIHPNLLPLLLRMHKRAGGKGLVVPALARANDDKGGEIMRRHLQAAGCKRKRLYTWDGAQCRVQFRSWRDAGITWSIVSGVDILKVQRRAGHRLIATTQGYIVEAENRGATFGEPFPPLPAALLGEPEATPESGTNSGRGFGQAGGRTAKASRSLVNSVPKEGLETTQVIEYTTICGESKMLGLQRVEVSPRELVPFGPSKTTLEDTLAMAISEAAKAGRWDIVAQLARELEARRLASAGIPSISGGSPRR